MLQSVYLTDERLEAAEPVHAEHKPQLQWAEPPSQGNDPMLRVREEQVQRSKKKKWYLACIYLWYYNYIIVIKLQLRLSYHIIFNQTYCVKTILS